MVQPPAHRDISAHFFCSRGPTFSPGAGAPPPAPAASRVRAPRRLKALARAARLASLARRSRRLLFERAAVVATMTPPRSPLSLGRCTQDERLSQQPYADPSSLTGQRSLTRYRISRGLPLHPRHPPDDVPRTAVDDAAVCGVRVGTGVESPLSVSPGSRGHRAQRRVRSANPDGVRLGSRARRGRSRARRRRDRLDRRYG